MPITAIIRLRAQRSGKISRSFHCLMHPIFLERIQQVSPALSARLHDSLKMSPFSLSPVMGVYGRVRESQRCWVRIGLLTDELQESFVRTLESGGWMQPLQLGEHIFQVEDILWGRQEGERWSGYGSYEALSASSEYQTKLSLKIQSPLAFKRSDVHYPYPEPVLFFRNLLKRWNLFAPAPFSDEADFSRVSFSRFEIKTRPYALRNGGSVIGCVGEVDFLLKQCAPETAALCNRLLRFAFYAGVGVKTTQGMGMVLPGG